MDISTCKMRHEIAIIMLKACFCACFCGFRIVNSTLACTRWRLHLELALLSIDSYSEAAQWPERMSIFPLFQLIHADDMMTM